MYKQIMQDNKETYTATEAGKILGVSPDTVMKSIENGTMPVGISIRPECSHERWRCVVFRSRLMKYLKGEL